MRRFIVKTYCTVQVFLSAINYISSLEELGLLLLLVLWVRVMVDSVHQSKLWYFCRRSLARRFWNQILTCLSVRPTCRAMSAFCVAEMYVLATYCCSSCVFWRSLYTVRYFSRVRVLPACSMQQPSYTHLTLLYSSSIHTHVSSKIRPE